MPYKNPEHKRLRTQVYYDKNREKIKERAKAWVQDNPDRRKEYVRQYNEANKEKIAAYRHERYLANREWHLEQTRANAKRRFEEDPERIRGQQRASTARRRARQRLLYVENVEPSVVWERDQGICQICGEEAECANWHLDHIIPIAKGGEHSYANVQVSHPLCNRRKAASCPTS